MFWMVRKQDADNLCVLPGRDLWSRSRQLLKDTSRFGHMNLNGIYAIEEGDEFIIKQESLISFVKDKSYIVLQKGVLVLPIN